MTSNKNVQNEEVKVPEQLEPIGEIKMAEAKKFEQCEWCFQFDEDEPQIFAWTDNESDKNEDPKVIFTITNVENSYITFQNGKTGKVFKLFARELTNEGIELRNKQKQAFKTIENASENKEA
jgi:hypothetical protein